MKKINCKHGLAPKEELEARRLRRLIETEEKDDILKERIDKLHEVFEKNIQGSFYDFIKENDIVLYSAFARAGGVLTMYKCLKRLNIY